MKMRRGLLWVLALLMALTVLFTSCNNSKNSNDDLDHNNNNGIVNSDTSGQKNSTGDPTDVRDDNGSNDDEDNQEETDLYPLPEGIAPYSGNPYVVLNSNKPQFTAEEITTQSFEFYSELDNLGRCGYAIACVGKDLMPTIPRGDIGGVTPSGWVNKKYDTSIVSGGYIYNRCHLLGWQLTGEDANKKNLITGTKYINIEGMLPFENEIADYVKETGNHVMYRVTPIFVGNNLVASGVQLEAYSVEDSGAEICFNVFSYNIQPGIVIDYSTGENWLAGESNAPKEPEATEATEKGTDAGDDEDDVEVFILNTKTKKIHKSTCSNARDISVANKAEHVGDFSGLLNQGYTTCGNCNPVFED